MNRNYDFNIKFKDVREGQSFTADDVMYIKLMRAGRSDKYNAKEVVAGLKRYAVFNPDDIVAVISNSLV